VPTLPQRPILAPPGLTAAELLERHSRPPSPLSADELGRWLVAERLAVADEDGRLYPTVRGRQLADAWAR
jgi:hypothetical protein